MSEDNITAVIISHESEATKKLLARIKYMLANLPIPAATQYDTQSLVTFPKTNSTIYIGTAGSRSFGRGDTITHLHCSEFAFWPNIDLVWTGLKEAVTPNGVIYIESTPNGIANGFYDLWQDAKNPHNEFRGFFYPWYKFEGNALEEQAPAPFTPTEQGLINQGVALEQLAWRRKKLGVGAGQEPAKKVLDKFLQEHAEDEVSCFLQSGRPVFDQGIIQIGCQEQLPKSGVEYIVGADTAEGINGDYDVATVINKQTGEQVKTIVGHWPVDVYARKLVELAKEYNNALLAIERNNHGHAVILGVQQQGYMRLYVHEDGKYGWLTSSKTKPLMIDQMEQAVREKYLLLSCNQLLVEMQTFQYNEKGSAQAQPGKHDDIVMATAIAWAVRNRPTGRIFTSKPAGF